MDQLNYQRIVMLNENFITESLGQLKKVIYHQLRMLNCIRRMNLFSPSIYWA